MDFTELKKLVEDTLSDPHPEESKPLWAIAYSVICLAKILTTMYEDFQYDQKQSKPSA